MRRLHIKRGVGKFSVALILSIQLFGILTPSLAIAATNSYDGGGGGGGASVFSSQSSIASMSRLWTEVQAAIYQCSFVIGINDDAKEAGRWFSGDAKIGLHVEPDDGVAKCNNTGQQWVTELLDKAGFSGNYIAAYKEIVDHHVNNPGGSVSGFQDDLRAFFAKYIFSGSSGMVDSNARAPLHVAYDVLYTAFVSPKGCSATQLTSATPDQITKAKDSGRYHKINVYQPDNTVQVLEYTYAGDKDKRVVIGRGIPGDGSNLDAIMECQNIAKQLENPDYANALVSWAKIYQSNNGVPPQTTGQVGTGATAPKSCETVGSGPLTWIFCGIINMLDGIISWFDTQIQSLLRVNKDVFQNSSIKQTWGVIRNIAFMILIPMMMLMVIGTALDFGPFDPYTVRKSLPRMIAAVLFIALSWQITTLLANMADVVGTGIQGLLTTAFGMGGTITLSSLFTPPSGMGIFESLFVGVGAVAGVAIAWTAGAIGIGIIASYAFAAALALFIGFITLVVRQMILIGLILFAPLAILVWIFPGNDKMWKLWWESYTKLLLMFPIIMVLIALGSIFARIAQVTGNSEVTTFLKLTAYIAPYFFIPTTFKLAGGAFATIAGITNDKSKGLFDRQAKYRANKRAYEMGQFKAGKRGGNIGKSLGRSYGAFTEPGTKKGSYLFNKNYRNDAQRIQDQIQEARERKDERIGATRENDSQQRALSYRNEAEARALMGKEWNMSAEDVEAGIRDAKAAGGWSRSRQIYALKQLAETGTGYDNIEQVQRAVSRVAGSDRGAAADLFGSINYSTKKSRHDLAAGYTDHMKQYEAIQARGGYEAVAGTNQSIISDDEARALYTKAAQDTDAVSLIRDKKPGVVNMSKAVAESFEIAQRRSQDASLTQAERDAARDEMVILKGTVDKVEQAFSYGSTNNVEAAGEHMVTPTSGIGGATTIISSPNGPIEIPLEGRQAVTVMANPQQTRLNPVTGQLETITMKDPVTGQYIPVPNATQDKRATELARRHGGRSRMDPNDPNL